MVYCLFEAPLLRGSAVNLSFGSGKAGSYYHAVELCFSNTIRLFGEINQRERSRARQQADI
jgi:hypothetical protein